MKKFCFFATVIFVLVCSIQSVGAYTFEEIFGYSPYAGKEFPSDKILSSNIKVGQYQFMQSLGKVQTGEKQYALTCVLANNKGAYLIDIPIKQLDTQIWVYSYDGKYNVLKNAE